jgi:WD40 repeat protein
MKNKSVSIFIAFFFFNTVLFSQSHTGRINNGAFSRSGDWLATSSNDSTAKIWDTRTGKLALDLGKHPGVVQSVSFSPDNKIIQTSCSDNIVRIWDATGKIVYTLQGETAKEDITRRLQCIAVFSPDGKFIATSSDGADDEGIVRIWELLSGKQVHSFNTEVPILVYPRFSDDGKIVKILTLSNEIQNWDLSTGKKIGTEIPEKKTRSSMISGNGKIKYDFERLNGEDLFYIDILDALTSVKISRLERSLTAVFAGLDHEGKLLFTAEDEDLNLWSTATGKLLYSLK